MAEQHFKHSNIYFKDSRKKEGTRIAEHQNTGRNINIRN
jgi:hypothetical protein